MIMCTWMEVHTSENRSVNNMAMWKEIRGGVKTLRMTTRKLRGAIQNAGVCQPINTQF